MTQYSGVDNLEVMAIARNYNAYLTGLLQREVRLLDSPRVVDFGAGIGTFAESLKNLGCEVTCVETDRTLAHLLRSKGLRVEESPDRIHDASVDFLYSLNVLEHIADHERAVRTWAEKLRQGGRLLVYVPAFTLLFSSMDKKVGHVRRYRAGELKRLIESAGFEIEESRYVDSIGFFASLAYRLIDPGTGEINPRQLGAYDRFLFPLSRRIDRLTGALFGKNVLLRAVRR